MLNWNLWHTWEHYGNVAVYLRMNGPPAQEARGYLINSAGTRPFA